MGSQGAPTLRRLAEEGGYSVQLDVFTDSFSIWSYLRSAHLKYPAEKGTFYHLAFLKELLDKGIISQMNWGDTRDMVVDGLTKGKLDREALQSLMNGWWRLTQAIQSIHTTNTSS